MSNIDYVIYCRKSTDETSWNQKQSIPDQIEKCIEYARREWIQIKEKPKDFSMFETELELEREDNESEVTHRRIYLETRNLFIIKEQETGKVPWKRKKWRQLMKLIDNWKVKWLLSYSPDRQARNMLEGWELINYVDEDKVELKYTNFHFENNASWKMMLWIWFVFSKQYSDKLSEDISRGNKSKVSSWKAIWRHKPGYIINEQGFHEPHPKFFPIIQEAFEMKLNWEVEPKIKAFINANWYRRTMEKTWEEKEIWKNWLNKMFQDEFYYWMFINWDTITDLRESNSYYKAIISEEQYQILQDRYYKNPTVIKKSITKDIYEDIKVFDVDFIITEDNYGFTFSLPNKKRYLNKIEKAGNEWTKLELKDVVKPNQIIYRCANKESKFYNLSVTIEDIDKAILNLLKGFKVWKKEFDEYLEFTNSRLSWIIQTTKEKIASKNLEIWRLKSEKERYIRDNMKVAIDEEEKRIYNKTKDEYDSKVKLLRKEIENLDEWERNDIVELEIFIDVLNNAYNYYKRASYVQKRKISKILFLNIKIDHQKRLQIQVKPEFRTLFNPYWWS